MARICRRALISLLGVAVAGVGSKAGAATTYDHIVVVMEENTSFNGVIGNPDAAYINSLANGGVKFTNFYSITHPSQPNYLQLFSGADQGIKDDTSAATVFAAPNLGAALINAGKTFVGYSESMPSVGYTGDEFTTVPTDNQYKRKHNPWVNWQAATPTGNQLPASVNQPFTSFPTTVPGYASLPTVAFVVPNEQNDMHDGTVAQADTWLSNNLSGYATWALTHNSLLIVTFDEDDSASNNHIPTLFYGANLKNTTIATRYTSHDLLATLANFTGVAASGMGVNAKPIYGALSSDATPITKTFQQGVSSYAGTLTNNIRADSANTAHPGLATIVADGDTGSGNPAQVLLKFANIFGAGATQVPNGATIVSAKLILVTDTGAATPFSIDTFKLYRLIKSWDGTSTWNSMTSGVTNDGIEAAANADFEILPYATANEWGIFDVTNTVQMWANGAANNGWFLTDANGVDGWRMFGETGSVTPRLEITFIPEPASAGILLVGGMVLLRRRRRLNCGE